MSSRTGTQPRSTRRTWQSLGLIGALSSLYGITYWTALPGLPNIALPVALAFIWLSVVDARTLTIPDAAIGLIFLCGMIQHWGAPDALFTAMLTALLCLGVFTGLSKLFARLLGRPALGFGDVKLLAASCMLIGAGNIIIAVFMAASAGILAVAALAALGQQKLNDPLPFGPFLAFAIWLSWRNDLWALYIASTL